MRCFQVLRAVVLSGCVLFSSAVANATVTVNITYINSSTSFPNGYVFSYMGDSSWGSSDPVINFVGSYVMKNDPDPNVGVICASESAYITSRYTAPNGSGSIDFQQNNTLPATLAPGDTTGGTYYFSVRPYNASYGPIRLNPPAYLPQLYTSQSIVITP